MKRKWLIILTAFSIILGGYLYYSWKHGGELLFDMKEILGETTNNSYGIRNDVYIFFQQDVKKSGIPELNEPVVQNLFLNFMKNEQLVLKHFSSKRLSIELNYKRITLMSCFFILSNRSIKYNKGYDYFSDKFISESFNKSKYYSVFLNSKDRSLIYDISDSYMNGKTLNPDERSPEIYPKLCDKFYDHVLTEEEFFGDL